MKIPKKLKIGKATWTVKLLKGFAKRYGCVGLCKKDKKIIIIDADQTRKNQQICFLHELLHACTPVGLVGFNTEEKFIEGIDSILHDALTKNKLF